MNIQQKRAKGAVTSHTELSWTMPEMRTRDGKHSTWLGNSFYFSLSTPLAQEEGKVHLFGSHTGIFRWHFSLLADWPPGLWAPFLATAEQDSSQEQLTLPSHYLTFLQTQLIGVLAKKRPKVQDCGLADNLSPTKVVHLDCFVIFFQKIFSPPKDFFPKLEPVMLQMF